MIYIKLIICLFIRDFLWLIEDIYSIFFQAGLLDNKDFYPSWYWEGKYAEVESEIFD